MGYDPTPWGDAGGNGPWAELVPWVERSAVFLLTMWDKVPRTWGERPRPVPAGALNVYAIRHGVGISEEPAQLRERHYVSLRNDKLHFVNPQEEEGLPRQRRAACFALTPEGESWARKLLAEAEDGRKPWLLDWRA